MRGGLYRGLDGADDGGRIVECRKSNVETISKAEARTGIDPSSFELFHSSFIRHSAFGISFVVAVAALSNGDHEKLI
jgi:hypothetical protein